MGGKKVKKAARSFSAEILERCAGAASRLAERLPSDNPAALWAEFAAECPGGEAALIEALSRIKKSEIADYLLQLIQSLQDKNLSKAARKSLYRLEQAGIAVDRKSLGDEPVVVAALYTKRASLGFLGVYDSIGDRPGVLAIPSRSGGYDVALAYLSQSAGLKGFEAWHATTSGLEKMAQSILESDVRSVQVPPEAVWFAIREANDLARLFGETDFEDYTAFVTLAGQIPVLARPMIYDLAEPASEVRLEPAPGIERLVRHDFLIGLFPFDELEPYMSRVDEAETSVLILSRIQKKERISDILDQAARSIYNEKRLAVLRRQLEETALLLWETGERDLAEAALTAAAGLEKEWSAGSPPEFIRVLLWETLEEMHGETSEEARDARETRERVTPAGLIVPE